MVSPSGDQSANEPLNDEERIKLECMRLAGHPLHRRLSFSEQFPIAGSPNRLKERVHQLRHHQFLIQKDNTVQVETIVDQVREILDADELGQLDLPKVSTATSSYLDEEFTASSSRPSSSHTSLLGRKRISPIDRGKFLAWAADVEKLISTHEPSDNHNMDPFVCLIAKFQMLQEGPMELAEVASNARNLLEKWNHMGAFDDSDQEEEQHQRLLKKQQDELETCLLNDMMYFDEEEFDSQKHSEAMARWALEEKRRVESSYAYQMVRKRAAQRLIKQHVVQWARSRQQFRDRVEEISVFGNTSEMFMDNLIKPRDQQKMLVRGMTTARRSAVAIGVGSMQNVSCICFKDLMGFSKHVATFDVDNAIRSIEDIFHRRRLLQERSALKFQLAYRRWKAEGGHAPDGSQRKSTIVDIVNQLKMQFKDKRQNKNNKKLPSAINEANPGGTHDGSGAGSTGSPGKKKMLRKVTTALKATEKKARTTSPSIKIRKLNENGSSSNPSSSSSSRRNAFKSESSHRAPRGNFGGPKRTPKHQHRDDSDKSSSSSLDSEEERELMRKLKDATDVLEVQQKLDAVAAALAGSEPHQDGSVSSPPRAAGEKPTADEPDTLAAARMIALSAAKLLRMTPKRKTTGYDWNNGLGDVFEPPPSQTCNEGEKDGQQPQATGLVGVLTAGDEQSAEANGSETDIEKGMMWTPPRSSKSTPSRRGRRTATPGTPMDATMNATDSSELGYEPPTAGEISETPPTSGTPDFQEEDDDQEDLEQDQELAQETQPIQPPRMLSIIERLQLEHEKERLLEQQRLKRIQDLETTRRLAKRRSSITCMQICQPFGAPQLDLGFATNDNTPDSAKSSPKASSPRARKTTFQDMGLIDLLSTTRSEPAPFLSLAALQNVQTKSYFHSMKLLLPENEDSEEDFSSDSDDSSDGTATSDPSTMAATSTPKQKDRSKKQWRKMSGSFDALRKKMKKNRESQKVSQESEQMPSNTTTTVESSIPDQEVESPSEDREEEKDDHDKVQEREVEPPEVSNTLVRSRSEHNRSMVSLPTKPMESLTETPAEDDEEKKEENQVLMIDVPKPIPPSTAASESESQTRPGTNRANKLKAKNAEEPSWKDMKEIIYRTPKVSSSPRAASPVASSSPAQPPKPAKKRVIVYKRRMTKSPSKPPPPTVPKISDAVEKSVESRVGAKKPKRATLERSKLPVIASVPRPIPQAKAAIETIRTIHPKKKTCVVVIPSVRQVSLKSLDLNLKQHHQEDDHNDTVAEEEEETEVGEDDESDEEDEDEEEAEDDGAEGDDQVFQQEQRDATWDDLDSSQEWSDGISQHGGISEVGTSEINLTTLVVAKSKRRLLKQQAANKSQQPQQVEAISSDAMEQEPSSRDAQDPNSEQMASSGLEVLDLQLDMKEAARSNNRVRVRVITRHGQTPASGLVHSPSEEFTQSGSSKKLMRKLTRRQTKRMRQRELARANELERKRKESEFQRLRSIYVGLLQCPPQVPGLIPRDQI